MYSKMDQRALKYMLIRGTIWNVIILIIAFIMVNIFSENLLTKILIVLGIVALIIVKYGLTYYNYKFYGYYYNVDEISVRKGVVFRKEAFMPFSRIQQIEIEANFIERALGIATITFTNAGSQFKIRYLDYEEAKELREKLIAMIEGNDE